MAMPPPPSSRLLWSSIFILTLLYVSTAQDSFPYEADHLFSETTLSHASRHTNYSWVPMSRPSYGPTCKFITAGLNCLANGRPDSYYARLFWTSNELYPSRFDAVSFLRDLRGKKLLLVGDSIMRNQWLSLLCLLESSLEGNNGYSNDVYSYYELTHDTTIGFYWLPMLVQCDERNSIAYIDKINGTAIEVMKRFDILVFDVAHWFFRTDSVGNYKFKFCKASTGACLNLDPIDAYREALETWAKVVNENFDKSTQTLIFRSKAIAHNGVDGCLCNKFSRPSDRFIPPRPAEFKVLKEVLAEMEFPVRIQSNTRMSGSRIDAHPGAYGKGLRCDCNHWCLPGLPDAWNILLAHQISLL